MAKEGHNAYVAGIYDRAASGYDESERGTFARSATILVAHAGVPNGGMILDVGTGTGAIPAAIPEGTASQILGIDISEKMLCRARDRFVERRDVRFEQIDATTLVLPDASFDLLLCSQALPFFQSRAAALREFFRVLKPGGTVAVGVRGPAAPVWQFLSRLVGYFDAAAPILGDPFQTRDWAAELREDMAKVGFCEVTSHEDAFEVTFPSFEDLWEHLWTSGFRASMELVPSSRLDEFRDSARAGVEAMLGTVDVTYRVVTISVIGRKPGSEEGAPRHA